MVKNYHCGDLLSPALQSMVEKKLVKLEKYGLNDMVVDVHMSKEGNDFVLKLQLSSREHDLLAKAKSNDMYKNIDECIDKLCYQIRENKK